MIGLRPFSTDLRISTINQFAMAAHTIQPEHVLSQVEDLNKIGREEESLELIHDYISNKRGKVWSHALESLMVGHVSTRKNTSICP